MLSEQGERLKLVRKRRQLGSRVVAQRAGISRTSVHMVESGDPGAILGTYLRVMAALGLEGDFNALAADDKVGCKLQDLALEAPRRRRTASTVARRVHPVARTALSARHERRQRLGGLARLRHWATMLGRYLGVGVQLQTP